MTGDENELAGQDSVERFLKQAPESLKKIEEAWNREVGTGKRERGSACYISPRGIVVNMHSITGT